MRIAYPGSAGSYTEEAATRLYPDAERVALGDFEAVAGALVAGEVDRAVLAIENSLAGLVPDTLTILERGQLSIVAEAVLHIPHCLVAVPGTKLAEVRIVHSHPMALAQCRTLLVDYERVGASTTADAARHVAQLGDRAVAAVASPWPPARTASRCCSTTSPTTRRTSRASPRSRATCASRRTRPDRGARRSG